LILIPLGTLGHHGHRSDDGRTPATAEQSGVSRRLIFPFPSMALADEEINERLLEEVDRVKKIHSLLLYSRDNEPIPEGKDSMGEMALIARRPGLLIQLPGFESPKLEEFIDASRGLIFPSSSRKSSLYFRLFVKRTKSLKIIIPTWRTGRKSHDFLDAFQGKRTFFFDTALAGSDTIMKFIDKIGPREFFSL